MPWGLSGGRYQGRGEREAREVVPYPRQDTVSDGETVRVVSRWDIILQGDATPAVLEGCVTPHHGWRVTLAGAEGQRP